MHMDDRTLTQLIMLEGRAARGELTRRDAREVDWLTERAHAGRLEWDDKDAIATLFARVQKTSPLPAAPTAAAPAVASPTPPALPPWHPAEVEKIYACWTRAYGGRETP
jgi:hypothetical protein